jgi:hypothetical protein
MRTSGSRGTGVDLHENIGSGTGVAAGFEEPIGLADAEAEALASGDAAALVVALGVADETA